MEAPAPESGRSWAIGRESYAQYSDRMDRARLRQGALILGTCGLDHRAVYRLLAPGNPELQPK